MKLKLIYALAIAATMSAFTSCSNNEPDEPVIIPGSTLEERTYYSTDNLTLTLDGAPLIGKMVTFTPAADGTATVTLSGEPLNASEILGMLTKADDIILPTIPTAGVLPGSPSVSIPVTLEGDADNCTFSGSGETDYCTYSYSGAATLNTLEFNLSDVKLKNTSLAGTWTVPDFLRDPDDDSSGYFFNVARVEWEASKGAEIELFPGYAMEMPVETVVRMALALQFMTDENGKSASLLQMLSKTLKNVKFGENGNITAVYLDTKTQEITESPVGFAQYVVASDGTLRLFLNPGAIIANSLKNVEDNTRAADLTIVIENLLTQIIPMFTEGIPVSYGPAIIDEENNTTEDATAFYLDTKTLLPLFKAFAPLMSDETFINSILDQLAADPSMAALSGSITGVLKSFPEIIDSTSKIEIGINLKR